MIKTEIQTKVVTQYVDKIIYRDRETTQVITKPDGTKIVTETKDKTSTDTKSTTNKNTQTDTKTDTVAKVPENHYFLGASYYMTKLYHPEYTEIVGGIRLGTLPIYLIGTSQPLQLTLGVGLVYQW